MLKCEAVSKLHITVHEMLKLNKITENKIQQFLFIKLQTERAQQAYIFKFAVKCVKITKMKNDKILGNLLTFSC